MEMRVSANAPWLPRRIGAWLGCGARYVATCRPLTVIATVASADAKAT
jgi:hypothetical protein